MSEAEKTIGRKLADAVNCIPTAEGRKYFIGFAEGAAAMAAELGGATSTASTFAPNSTTPHQSAQS